MWPTRKQTRPSRERLTLIRLFEELRGRGYDGGYDAVRRYARRWAALEQRMIAAAPIVLDATAEVSDDAGELPGGYEAANT